jgi:Leucine-rich repeat (LRR) protein
LDVSDNDLTCIEAVAKFQHLVRLNATKNRILRFNVNSPSISYLNLSENLIADVKPSCDLPSLSQLCKLIM